MALGKMITFQDFERAGDKTAFLLNAIDNHKASQQYAIAKTADTYDRQMNETIYNYVHMIFTLSGAPIEDFTASNSKIASNFFNRLNTQRCMYSLGNGITFANDNEGVKAKLGTRFDYDIKTAAYFALIHGVSFCFWNLDRLHVFPLTEFVPLWDEFDGSLKAGIRFWQIDSSRPMSVVLYEIDGYTMLRGTDSNNTALEVVEDKRGYIEKVKYVPADRYPEVIGETNYSSLPIVPMYASRLKQSTLVGMRQAIDSFDLIRSGFANDLTDCAEIYWIVENYGGMDDSDLAKFRDRLKITHIANVDSDEGGKVTPYTQEIPYAARKAYLDDIRSGIYEDFGALDVHVVAAGATNDHIDAAYQPLDENASEFEYNVSECIVRVLELMEIDDSPVFKRNRISNQKEQIEMVALEATWLDDETILKKLPNISPDEIETIMTGKAEADLKRFGMMGGE